jgi:hypothetical protein
LIHNQQTFKFGSKNGAWFDDENIYVRHFSLCIFSILDKIKLHTNFWATSVAFFLSKC